MKKFCISGGPCSGKTTGMCHIQEKLVDMGFHVLIVPESATLLMNGGINPEVLKLYDFEDAILQTTLTLEDIFIWAASKINKEVVILFDRGAVEIGAYMSNDMLHDLLQSKGLVITNLRDERYDATFFLRSAAFGAEQFYTTDNNPARLEATVEQAREADQKTLNMWLGARKNPHIVDNSTSFDGKMQRLFQAICLELGVPAPIEIERKFVVVPPADWSFVDVKIQTVDIEQVYLVNNSLDDELRVRKYGQNGYFTYYRTSKKEVRRGVRIKTEEPISREVYKAHIGFIHKGTRPLKKKRVCFVYNNQYFTVDYIDGIKDVLMEIKPFSEDFNIEMPPFVEVLREVTGDSKYFNRNLAKI